MFFCYMSSRFDGYFYVLGYLILEYDEVVIEVINLQVYL
jgi:hypothetical protein